MEQQPEQFRSQEGAPAMLLTFDQVKDAILDKADEDLRKELERVLIVHETQQELAKLERYQRALFRTEALTGLETLVPELKGEAPDTVEEKLRGFFAQHEVMGSSVPESSTEVSKETQASEEKLNPTVWDQVWSDVTEKGGAAPTSWFGGAMAFLKGTWDYIRGRKLEVAPEQEQALLQEVEQQARTWLNSKGVDADTVTFVEDPAHLTERQRAVFAPMMEQLRYGKSPQAVVTQQVQQRVQTGMLEQLLFDGDQLKSTELQLTDFV